MTPTTDSKHTLNNDELEVVATPVADTMQMDRDGSATVDPDESTVVGACVAGGLIGCVVGGPILACVAGGCSAYLTTRENTLGDCARCLGSGAVSTKNRAIELNEKHHITQRAQAAAGSCWYSMKDANERHKIAERTKSCLGSTWQGMKDMNQKYHLTERSLQAAGAACSFVGTQIEKSLIEERSQSEENSAPSASAAAKAPDEEGELRLPEGSKTNGGYFVIDTVQK